MDNRFYSNVIDEMTPFLEENKFTAQEDGSFLGEKLSLRIEYDEPRQMYLLKSAAVEEGAIGEYNEISAFLFDDSQNARDAVSVGVDFCETIRKASGIKATRKVNANIDLPTAKKGGAFNVSAFAKKVLDVFPQYKDAYKAHIAQYGNFLYLNFFADTLVPQLQAALDENSKKSLKKIYDLLDPAYIQGDKETVNTVIVTLTAAVFDNDNRKAAAIAMLEDDKHFQSALTAFIPEFTRNKKLRAAMKK